MGVWLEQVGGRFAHLYPDDEGEETAACGNELEDNCSECGQKRHVSTAIYKPMCPDCLASQEPCVAEVPHDEHCSVCGVHQIHHRRATPSEGVDR